MNVVLFPTTFSAAFASFNSTGFGHELDSITWTWPQQAQVVILDWTLARPYFPKE
jgi:hypothetical protein